MISKYCVGFIILSNLLNISCSAEVFGPVYRAGNGQMPDELVRNFGDNRRTLEKNYNKKIPAEKVKYISDISEMINIFPNFRNPDIDDEIRELKIALQYYIYSTIEGNINQKISSYKDYAKSYNQLQVLKRHLRDDDIELIDQYLIRIKANINSLEYLK